MKSSGLAGKTALVTGGSRGIGRAICLALAAEGVGVAINYAADDAAAEETRALVAAQEVPCRTYKADVSDEGQVLALVDSVERDMGPVDLLVTNAGISIVESPDALSFDIWKRIMAVNADGTYLPVVVLANRMVERRYGRIVCIASIAALSPRANLAAYSASKAAVIAFARNCSAAFAPHVRINTVAPGLIETEMAKVLDEETRKRFVAMTPLGRIGKPEEIAEMVLFLLSDRSSYTTGQLMVASGGRETLP